MEQMVTVTLPMKLWDELSELVWDRIPEVPCQGCGGDEPDGCGICHGTGLGTMYDPSLDHDPIVLAAREIDRRVRDSMSPTARRHLSALLRGKS